MRLGDFSGLPTIYDPNSMTGSQRQPFPDSQIPTRRLDPMAAALLAKIPLPDLQGIAQNLRSAGNQRVNGNQYTARLENQFSEKDTSYLRGSLFDAREHRSPSIVPGRDQTFLLHAEHTSDHLWSIDQAPPLRAASITCRYLIWWLIENGLEWGTPISPACAEYQSQSNDSHYPEHPHPTRVPPSHTITVHGAPFGIAMLYLSIGGPLFLGVFIGPGIIAMRSCIVCM
jgi:hypothetical protein